MYVQVKYPRTPNFYDEHICCLHFLPLPKLPCLCHELINPDFISRVSPKRPSVKTRNWLKALGPIGLSSLHLSNHISQDSPLPPFPPLPPPKHAVWLKKLQHPFSCSVMSPILDRTLEYLCFPCHILLFALKPGWR